MRRAARLLILFALLAPVSASTLAAQPPAPPPPAAQPAGKAYPTKDRFGRPLPALTFYCQYLGLAKDDTGKYPLYRNGVFTMASAQGAVQNAWGSYIETTYHPTSPGNAMCAIVPDDPAQRAAAMKAVDLLKQPATQRVVTTSWKP